MLALSPINPSPQDHSRPQICAPAASFGPVAAASTFRAEPRRAGPRRAASNPFFVTPDHRWRGIQRSSPAYFEFAGTPETRSFRRLFHGQKDRRLTCFVNPIAAYSSWLGKHFGLPEYLSSLRFNLPATTGFSATLYLCTASFMYEDSYYDIRNVAFARRIGNARNDGGSQAIC